MPLAEDARISDVDETTRAFSMTPGRIYINQRGREPRGSVEPGAEYEALREEIAAGLEASQLPPLSTANPWHGAITRIIELLRGGEERRAAAEQKQAALEVRARRFEAQCERITAILASLNEPVLVGLSL